MTTGALLAEQFAARGWDTLAPLFRLSGSAPKPSAILLQVLSYLVVERPIRPMTRPRSCSMPKPRPCSQLWFRGSRFRSLGGACARGHCASLHRGDGREARQGCPAAPGCSHGAHRVPAGVRCDGGARPRGDARPPDRRLGLIIFTSICLKCGRLIAHSASCGMSYSALQHCGSARMRRPLWPLASPGPPQGEIGMSAAETSKAGKTATLEINGKTTTLDVRSGSTGLTSSTSPRFIAIPGASPTIPALRPRRIARRKSRSSTATRVSCSIAAIRSTSCRAHELPRDLLPAAS